MTQTHLPFSNTADNFAGMGRVEGEGNLHDQSGPKSESDVDTSSLTM